MSESEQAPSTSDQREEASAPPAEGAPTRWGVLMRNPKRLIIALVLIVVAISAAAFASATFTSTSANPGNLATTGSLLIENSEDGAILTATGLVPGDSRNGSVTISNVGDSAGNFSLTTEDLVDTPPTPPLSGRLDLLIEDITVPATPTETYRGQAERRRHRPARRVGERRDPHVQVHADLSGRDTCDGQPVPERGVDGLLRLERGELTGNDDPQRAVPDRERSLWRTLLRDRRFLSVLVILLAATLVGSVVFTVSAFTSTSSNAASIRMGEVRFDVSPAGVAVVDTTALRPGATAAGEVQLTNRSVPATFTLAFEGVAPGPLVNVLGLKVQEVGGQARVFYDGPLASVTPLALGRFSANAGVRLRLTFAWPAGSKDPLLQARTVPVVLRWNATT